MASLAALVNPVAGANEFAGAASAPWTRETAPRLRPIANEDVYLFVKRIDNTGVIRAADPRAGSARTRSVAVGFLAAMLIIAGLVPAAYNTISGFTLQNLTQERADLKKQQMLLTLEEAQLLSTPHLNELAKSLHMVKPAPEQVQYLDSKSKAEAQVVLPTTPGDTRAR